MKKIILLSLLAGTFTAAQAQNFSGGLRTGASAWMDKTEGKCFSNAGGKNATWDKEFFVRYQTKGKFAFEAGIGHYAMGSRLTDDGYRNVLENGTATTYRQQTEQRSQHVEWNVSAQYDMSCPALQERCPLMKKLKSYVGVVASPTWSRITTSGTGYEGIGNFERTRDDWRVWTGVSHTMVYSLCENMYLSSSVRMQIDPANFFNGSTASTGTGRDSRLGMQIGLGYNLR